MRIWLLISIVAATLACGEARSLAAPSADPNTNPAAVYDPDPDHLWNRVFATFYRQYLEVTFIGIASNPPPKGLWIGPDVLDPPIRKDADFLADHKEFLRCNAVLEEFLQEHGEKLIRDPLKRAVFQRDLWAVFDIVQSDENAVWTSRQRRRVTMGRNLAQIISAVALSRAEIEALPNTFREAIASGAFSPEPKRGEYNLLATDLLDPKSGWIELGPKWQFFHSTMVRERSVFRIFFKAPPDSPGAMAAHEWQRQINENRRLREKNPGQTVDDPPAPSLSFVEPTGSPPYGFPLGTQLLLLREMLCIDADGLVRPTHIVESVQMRGVVMQGTNQLRYAREVELNRKLLFQHSQGGLRPIIRDELRADGYSSLGSLQIDKQLPLRPFPQNCGGCHAVDGLFSSGNVTIARGPDESAARTIAGKISRADYLQLREWLSEAAKH